MSSCLHLWHRQRRNDYVSSYRIRLMPAVLQVVRFWRGFGGCQREAEHNQLGMWANAQRDGRPAEYRWRPLFNSAKFG